MFDAIRNALFNKAYTQVIRESKRKRNTFGISTASSIGILFDATLEKSADEAQMLARTLEKKGKKVRLLGYINSREKNLTRQFDFFSIKDLNWKGIPQAEQCSKFEKEVFQLLVCFNPSKVSALEWIAANSASLMKTGVATGMPNDYDLQLDLPAGKNIHFFIEQLENYLDKIVLNKYESAAAL